MASCGWQHIRDQIKAVRKTLPCALASMMVRMSVRPVRLCRKAPPERLFRRIHYRIVRPPLRLVALPVLKALSLVATAKQQRDETGPVQVVGLSSRVRTIECQDGSNLLASAEVASRRMARARRHICVVSRGPVETTDRRSAPARFAGSPRGLMPPGGLSMRKSRCGTSSLPCR